MDTLSAAARAASVYSTAARVMFNVKRAQWQEKSIRRRLGLPEADDSNSSPDRCLEIEALWDDLHELNAQIVSKSIVELRGLWIKVGQYLSSRPDIVPAPYISHFRQLQDALPSRPWSEVDETLRMSLGADYRVKYFSEIVKRPMSSASIAQVHRATLLTGDNVVIKARHKNVEQLMLNDLKNLKTLCAWIVWVNSDYDFRQIVKEYHPAVKAELDLRNEAQNLIEVKKNMEAADIRVIIPTVPNKELVKPDVLVMEYCQGFSVRDTDAIDRHGVDRVTLLDRICTSWAVQMHRDGLFNADPHPGNILVSTDPLQNGGDSSVPILLDFGLARRFNDDIKVAFSRMIHACYAMDVDSLLRSFEEMGLKIRGQDPFQDISNLRRAFQTVPASEAKAVREQRKTEYRAKQKDRPSVKRPVDAWPGELVFFVRVIGLLKGLCSTMEVRYPYLKTTAAVALETLKSAVAEEHHAKGLLYPDTRVPSGPLQDKIRDVVENVNARRQFVGMQVAAIHKGSYVVDIAAGTLGIADPRPVKPNTLFNVFSVTKGIATTLLHMAIQRNGKNYDDLVSSYWPGFEENGKECCTLRHVLNHQAGLAGALPDIVTLDEILDWKNMLNHLKGAKPTAVPGTVEEYHYMTYGYLVGGILEGMTGMTVEELLAEWLVKPLQLEGQMFVGLPKDISDDRLAVLQNAFLETNVGGMLQSFGEESGVVRSSSVPRWEKFKGSEQLFNPTTFNMRQVREACIPSANGHMSARALAAFYGALSTTDDHPVMDFRPVFESIGASPVKKSDRFDVFSSSADRPYALGYRVYKFRRDEDGQMVYGLGHPGLGGSFGLVIPGEEFAIGVTTNYLMADRSTQSTLLLHVCEYLGLSVVVDESYP